MNINGTLLTTIVSSVLSPQSSVLTQALDGSLLATFVRISLAVLAAALGVLVLLRGRRYLWLFSGAAAFLLGVLAVRIVNWLFGGDAFNPERLSWEELIPIGAAVAGALIAAPHRLLAYAVIGISTGGALAIWIGRLFLPPETGLDIWAALGIVLGMALGYLFVIRYTDVALIIVSVGVGIALITYALNLPVDSQFIAALTLAAGIAGLVVQYHDYLAEQRAAHLLAVGTEEVIVEE
jgi:hypothetical protein